MNAAHLGIQPLRDWDSFTTEVSSTSYEPLTPPAHDLNTITKLANGRLKIAILNATPSATSNFKAGSRVKLVGSVGGYVFDGKYTVIAYENDQDVTVKALDPASVPNLNQASFDGTATISFDISNVATAILRGHTDNAANVLFSPDATALVPESLVPNSSYQIGGIPASVFDLGSWYVAASDASTLTLQVRFL